MTNFNADDTFLARWLNNELTEAELKVFKASEDYESYHKIAEKSKQFQIPAFDKAGVKANIQSKLNSSSTKVVPLYRQWAAAAAVILICALAGAFYWISLPTTFSTKIGEQMAFELPDGSTVKLNGKATVSFLKSDWKNDKRDLNLTGEGYFIVKKGSKFNVQTANGTVSVVGTQFNVNVLDTYFAVECYEGKVSVNHKSSTTLLTPGHGIRYKNDIAEKTSVNHTKPQWINTNYTYNNVPLMVVLNDLQNVYKMNVDMQNIDISEEFTGKLITYDINKALKAICKPMKLNYVIDGTQISIKSN
ncbi:FecR family protein [Aquimarina agarivorans]|uniref:FecR family protein n=1 Tax=Aquimarina agarivorans TaxID=980584 RepID=UPI000248FD8C|nr:FecR domain-containing protein [Aquimarina agarivorans]